MSNLVIVAIPKEDDYVNKISSEKVAHMTLLFLGEVNNVKNLSEILDFTKHAADQSLMRFELEVDRREILGPDLADTLIFSKSKWSGFDTINNYRSNLLKYDNIRTAYDSTEQFSEWIPHLTLGYPDTPAKPDEREYPGIRYISFDRIAVWFSDFEGIDFPLKSYDYDEVVAMGNLTTKSFIENFLEHMYDPVKAHEYYIKTRELKGSRKASSVLSRPRVRTINTLVSKPSTFTVTTRKGKKLVLTQQQLVEQQAYAAKRVGEIKTRLVELGAKLKKMMAETKKAPTAAEKSKAARQSKQYRKSHKQELATKEKTARVNKSVAKKNPVAELENKINQVKGSLKAALEVQRSLTKASKNTG